MCLVFSATHLQIAQPVILKLLVPETVTSLSVHARFLREVQSVARLCGEHVARTIDVGILPEGIPYAVMEALHGIDLGSERARRGVLMPGEAVDYILQACEALAEAHAHGIVHGDIKPANLFFTARPDGSVFLKVLGFELSRAGVTPPGARPAVPGTPGYMAPEQIQPIEELDGRADVWALGIVLYECLTGRHPFQAESMMLQAAVSDSPRPMDPTVPRPLQAVVLRCLENARDARFPSIAVLAAALAPFAHDQRAATAIVDRASFMSQGPGGGFELAPHAQYPIIVPPTVGPGMTRSPLRRRYAMIGLAALALSLSGIAAAALIAPSRSDDPGEPRRPGGPGGSSTAASAPATAGATFAVGREPGTPPGAPAATRGPSTQPPAQPPAASITGNAASAPAQPPAASTTGNAASAQPLTASTAAPKQPVRSPGDSIVAGNESAKSASDSTIAGNESAKSASDLAIASDDSAKPTGDSTVASDESTRSASESTAGDTRPQRVEGTAGRSAASATAERAAARTPKQPVERAAERPAAVPSSPAGSRSRRESCDAIDADDLMTRAAIQYDAGSPGSALSFTRVALGCKQTDRMYWLAVLYACAAHDLAAARLYFTKVPTNVQSGLETKCQRENLDVRSR